MWLRHTAVGDKLLLAGLMVGCVGSSVYADTFTLSGEVAAVNSLTFTNTVTAFSGNLAAGDHALTTMEIDNNDPDGFKISVSSEKASKLVRYSGSAYYSDTVAGNTVGYTMTFTAGTGTLGVTEATSFTSAITLPATGSATDFSFSTSRTAATQDKQYAVKLTVANPTHLLNSSQSDDVYRDVISISIANL